MKNTGKSHFSEKNSRKRSNKKSKKRQAKLFKLFLLVLFFSLLIFAKNYRQNYSADSSTAAETQSDSISTTAIPVKQPEASTEPLQNAGQKPEIQGQLTSELELPLCNEKPGENHEIVSHNGFTLCYREEYEQSEWVAYEFTKSELIKASSRSNNFKADPAISTLSATPEDYTRSGYDRGHLAPAADLSWSTESMNDSFYMSNMSPQAPSFNRGIWKNLEEKVRTWVEKFGTVYVVSGPILEKPASEYKSIGKNQVSVPEFYYKALLAKDEDGKLFAIGFILPNEKSSENIFTFAVPVDEVENRTGLDFFAALPDETENQLERSFSISDW